MTIRTVTHAMLRPRGLRLVALCVTVVLALVGMARTFAQEEYQLSVDQVITSTDGAQLTALASVLDSASRPVVGLTSFEAAIDGEPVPLVSVEPVVNDETGVAVLLLIDVSGSMQGEPLAQARVAAETFVSGLLAQDVAAVLPFAGTVSNEADFTADREVLLAQIRALRVQRTGTALYDAVVKGLSSAVGAPVPRRAVVLLTDGRDQEGVSKSTRADTLRAATEAGLPIFSIGLGESADVDFLRRLSEAAGGALYRAPGPADVPAIFDAIGTKLRSQYALTLSLPASGLQDRVLEISVSVEGGVLTSRASFRAPVVLTDVGAEEESPAGEGAGQALSPEVEGESQSLWRWPAVILALVLLIGAAAILVRGRLRRRTAISGGPGQSITLPNRPRWLPEAVIAPAGRLTVVEGPDTGASVALASAPVDIGTDSTCGLRLDAAGGEVAGRHARVWLQSNRFLLHHLARGRQTLVQEKPVEWATLEPSDTLRIGPHVIALAVDG